MPNSPDMSEDTVSGPSEYPRMLSMIRTTENEIPQLFLTGDARENNDVP